MARPHAGTQCFEGTGARIEALCTSKKKGERKQPIETVLFRSNHGIVGDAHAGEGLRQVSLLSNFDIDVTRRKLPQIAPGDFAENVVISGLDFFLLGVGSSISLGKEVVLRITQIGKTCHAPCKIQRLTGDCIMPKFGLFARVETGGEVHTGDTVSVVEAVGRELSGSAKNAKDDLDGGQTATC